MKHRIYKYEDGREFRLAGTEVRHGVYYITIKWIDNDKYEEFVQSQLEPYMPFEETSEIVVAEKVEKIEKVKREPKAKKPKDTDLNYSLLI